jgi:uncharacterized membrane protein YebE (DUF533 family)
MDESVLFNGVLRSLLGGRRRRSRRTMGFLTGVGGSLLSNPQALLTAAGVAWGIFETMQQGTSGQTAGTGGAGLNTTGAGLTPANTPGAMPPLPVTGTPLPRTTDALRMVRLALSAAQADGALSEQERTTILQKAGAAGVANVIETELQRPSPLAEIVSGVSDPGQCATLYSLAFAVVRADEQVGGAERIYLAQLANLLGLDPAAAQKLESDAGAKIDATPEAN